MIKKAVLALLTLIGVALALAPFAPPALRALGFPHAAEVLDHPWTLTCHRMADRTMSIFGSKMPMCSRCTGIVTGLGLGLIIGRPYGGPTKLWITLGIASVLLLLEMQTQEWGWHSVSHPTRLFTGFFLAYPVAAAGRAVAGR